MTVKTWEVKPHNQQGLNDAGSQRSARASVAQLTVEPGSGTVRLLPQRKDGKVLLGRRRTIARMIRVELEVTLALLDQALEEGRGTSPPDAE